MSVLAVGSVAFDSIVTPSGRADSVLGGSATYFSLAASYFTEVRIVAVVGEDFTTDSENVFKKRSIDTYKDSIADFITSCNADIRARHGA